MAQRYRAHPRLYLRGHLACVNLRLAFEAKPDIAAATGGYAPQKLVRLKQKLPNSPRRFEVAGHRCVAHEGMARG